MNEINWKQKLSSRKFWAAVVGFVSALLVGFGMADNDIAQITSIIMAGGTLIVLGLENPYNQPLVGAHCATGMHGGRIFLRGEFPEEHISEHISVLDLDEKDRADLERHVRTYCERFGADFDKVMDAPFHKLIPTTSRPYANLYTPN